MSLLDTPDAEHTRSGEVDVGVRAMPHAGDTPWAALGLAFEAYRPACLGDVGSEGCVPEPRPERRDAFSGGQTLMHCSVPLRYQYFVGIK